MLIGHWHRRCFPWNRLPVRQDVHHLGGENRTLPPALRVFVEPDQGDWGAIMAGSTLMTIPVLVFVLARRLVAGPAGAVKS